MEDPATEDYVEDLLGENRKLYADIGIDETYSPKLHKKVLEAVKITRVKVKGVVKQETTPTGRPKKGAPKVVGVSGIILDDVEKGLVYGDGESVLEFHDADLALREKARLDLDKKLGYVLPPPIQKHELSGSVQVTPRLSEEDRAIAKNMTEQAINAIIDKHRRAD